MVELDLVSYTTNERPDHPQSDPATPRYLDASSLINSNQVWKRYEVFLEILVNWTYMITDWR